MASLSPLSQVLLTIAIAVIISTPWVYILRRNIINTAGQERVDAESLREAGRQRQKAYEELAVRYVNLENRFIVIEQQALRVTALESEVTALRDENIKLSRQIRDLQQQLSDARSYNEHLQSKLPRGAM